MKKFLLIARFLFIIFLSIIYHTSAHSFSSFGKYTGQGEIKLPKDTFDLLEFYFSGGKYGEIYNNPKYDWEKEMIKKKGWIPKFFIVSKNGKGIYWYYSNPGFQTDTTPNYLGNARNQCTKQGHGECFVFAIKNKIVWQNGINPEKGTKIKKKEARKGMLSAKLKELGFYDGGITKTKKIEKKKVEKKKEPKKNYTVIVKNKKDKLAFTKRVKPSKEDAIAEALKGCRLYFESQGKEMQDACYIDSINGKKYTTAEKTSQTDDSNDIVQQIKDLKELYDSGVLTKEEFEKAKKKLLN